MTPGTPAVLSGLLLLLLLLLSPAAGPARAADAGAIVTGPPGSTSLRVGQDVADLARRFGVALEVVPSPGGPANVEALTQRPGTLLAIVPSDTEPAARWRTIPARAEPQPPPARRQVGGQTALTAAQPGLP